VQALSSFPAWIRAAHLLNLIFIGLLIRSGPQILSSLPKLYWSDHCTPGAEWLRFTRKDVPTDRPWVSLEEEVAVPSWLALPGGKRLGMGRHWHLVAVLGWVMTGTGYVAALFATSEWRRLVPTSWSIVPGAWHTLVAYLHLRVTEGHPFNPLQQLAYFAVVFLLGPLTIATGAAMSPALIARFPRYARMFGGKQAARSIHFLCLVAFVLFTLVHTAMVILHGLPTGFAKIVLGSGRADHAEALWIGFLVLVALLVGHVAVTLASIRHPRRIQRLLGFVVDPFQRLATRRLRSNQHYLRADISPYFRRNGYPPNDERYRRPAGNSFADWRLEVGGLVEQPLSLGLDELHALERSVQVTKHNCIQGWTAVGEWAGVSLGSVLELARPTADARYAVFHAMDDKSETHAEDEEGEGYFYEVIGLELARQPQTILAYELNGASLPIEHGAPLRLRLETQLGIKMVKWIRAIELVDDYSQIGQGQGGWREDNAFYSQTVAI
jgi:DMSO/TMAO reductase YedYZ molybdopterin-dependent catalytic subunit